MNDILIDDKLFASAEASMINASNFLSDAYEDTTSLARELGDFANIMQVGDLNALLSDTTAAVKYAYELSAELDSIKEEKKAIYFGIEGTDYVADELIEGDSIVLDYVKKIIAGDYGNGAEREDRLRAELGDKYDLYIDCINANIEANLNNGRTSAADIMLYKTLVTTSEYYNFTTLNDLKNGLKDKNGNIISLESIILSGIKNGVQGVGSEYGITLSAEALDWLQANLNKYDIKNVKLGDPIEVKVSIEEFTNKGATPVTSSDTVQSSNKITLDNITEEKLKELIQAGIVNGAGSLNSKYDIEPEVIDLVQKNINRQDVPISQIKPEDIKIKMGVYDYLKENDLPVMSEYEDYIYDYELADNVEIAKEKFEETHSSDGN